MLLSKASKFALYALVEMALTPDDRVSAKSIAERFGISMSHVAKVLQQLMHAGLIESTRGVGGGYALAVCPAKVSMADVIAAIEGPIADDGCFDCPIRESPKECATNVATCSVHTLLTEVRSHARYTFESVTIKTLAQKRGVPTNVQDSSDRLPVSAAPEELEGELGSRDKFAR